MFRKGNLVGGSSSSVSGLVWLCMLVAMLYNEHTRWIGASVLGITLLVTGAIFLWVWQSESRKNSALISLQDSARRKTQEIVSAHLDTLANQRDVQVRTDRYGVVHAQDWNKEVQHFVDKVIRPNLTADEATAVAKFGMSAFFQNLIEERVAKHCDTRPAPDRVRDGMTPLEFEGACAAVLRDLGWEASTTKGSGDQGADVIATKFGRRLVLQCKLYTGVVGNKSIQEVIAAKIFYKADLAAVVCNSAYTKSATTLAISSGVATLTYPELRSWAAGLGSMPVAQSG